MAVVADSHAPVASPLPCHIFGRHDMAVDAGSRIVGEIRCRVGNSENNQEQCSKKSAQHHHGSHPFLWRENPLNYVGNEVEDFAHSRKCCHMHSARTSVIKILGKKYLGKLIYVKSQWV